MKVTSRQGAILYVRSASEVHLGDDNLKTQERRCRKFCHEQGWPVKSVFVDKAQSCLSLQWPQFQKMLSYCKRNRDGVRYVVVADLTRVGRSLPIQAEAIGLLNRCGVLVRSIFDGDLDSTPIGKLELDLVNAFRRFHSKSRSEK